MHLFKTIYYPSQDTAETYFTLFYLIPNLLPRNLRALSYPMPHTDLEWVHIRNKGSPKLGAPSPSWAEVLQRRKRGASQHWGPILFSGALAAEHPSYYADFLIPQRLASAVFSKADSFLTLGVPPALTGTMPSSLLIMGFIYMCSDNIANFFFNEFK